VNYKVEWEGFSERPVSGNRFGGEVAEGGDIQESLEKAQQMARMNNNVWLEEGITESYWEKKNEPMEGILAGTTKHGTLPAPEVMERAAPVFKILGNIAELLSVEGGCWRFKYYGQIKNKRGMEFYTEKLLRDEGLECTGVRFETGGRVRDYGD